jgi:hypothetical protein
MAVDHIRPALAQPRGEPKALPPGAGPVEIGEREDRDRDSSLVIPDAQRSVRLQRRDLERDPPAVQSLRRADSIKFGAADPEIVGGKDYLERPG